MESDGKVAPDLSSLLSVNQLDFRLPPSLSVANSRAMKQYRSSRQVHEFGSMIEIVLSTGASYIDMKNSFLSFDVQCSEPVVRSTISLPSNAGWQQLFNAYTCVHSSGVELDRQKESVGEWEQIRNYYEKDAHWRKTVAGALWGHRDVDNTKRRVYTAPSSTASVTFGPGGTAGATNLAAAPAPLVANALNGIVQPISSFTNSTTTLNDIVPDQYANQYPATLPANTPIRVVIPFSCIAPMFANANLCPSYLCAGLRIELYTSLAKKFFVSAAAPPGTWTIQNVRANMESFTLTDAITRKLAQISASSGLEWNWTAVHWIAHNPIEDQFSIHVSRSMSRANNVVLKVRDLEATSKETDDSYSSQAWLAPGYGDGATGGRLTSIAKVNGTLQALQVQLGSQFMPSKPIDNLPEAIHSALKVFGGMRRTDTSIGLTLEEFAGKETAAYAGAAAAPDVAFTPSVGILAVPLESSSTLQQSGSVTICCFFILKKCLQKLLCV